LYSQATTYGYATNYTAIRHPSLPNYPSADWKAGRLAIIVLADENDSTQGNKVLTTVIHRSQSHRVVTTALTHYSLTGCVTLSLAGVAGHR
jgi:hypothetical protein